MKITSTLVPKQTLRGPARKKTLVSLLATNLEIVAPRPLDLTSLSAADTAGMHSEAFRWIGESLRALDALSKQLDDDTIAAGDARFDNAVADLHRAFEGVARSGKASDALELWRNEVGPNREFLLIRDPSASRESQRLRTLQKCTPPVAGLLLDHQVVGLAYGIQAWARSTPDDAKGWSVADGLVGVLHEARVFYGCDWNIAGGACSACERLLRRELAQNFHAPRLKDGRLKGHALEKVISHLLPGLTTRRFKRAVKAWREIGKRSKRPGP